MTLDGDKRQVPGADIECLRYSNVQGDIFHARTDTKGQYRLGLLPAQYECRATAGDVRSLPAMARATARLDFRLERPAPAPTDVVEWIREHAIPLLSVQPGHGLSDMKPLRELVGRARIVGLGEATHGSREFFQAKHRMFEYLATELEFTVFAIEAGFSESEAVNDYVMTGRGDPEQALAGLIVWPWDTEEVLDLIRWMRAWNAEPRNRRKLSFHGFDMQFTSRSVATVLQFLDEVDPVHAAEMKTQLSVLSTEMEPQKKQQAIAARADALKTTLRELGQRLERERTGYTARAGRRSWLVARQSIRVLEQNVDANTDPRGSSLARDRYMAENLRWIADVAEPKARIVAWAHNGHIANRTSAGWAMGAHLEAAYGADYLPIEFSFHRGSFQAYDVSGRGGLVAHAVGPAPAGSIDDTFHRAGWPIFVLDLRKLPRSGPVAAWFGRPQPRREGGAIVPRSDEDMVVALPLAAECEAVVFIDSTTRARPNPNTVRRHVRSQGTSAD